jgi:glycosyltransferase involved in cell wall biosynthesis
MVILGIFLINQIRTGGDRDYIELLELLAKRGNTVFVIINSFLKYKTEYVIPIYLDINYKRRGFPPASFLFKYYIKKYFSFIFKLFNGIFPHFIHIHGDIYLKSALYLKKKLNTPLFYASRCNDVDRTTILRFNNGYSKKEYLFSIIYQFINRHREKMIAKYADIITFLNPSDRDCFISRTYRKDNEIFIIPNNIGLPHFSDETKSKNASSHISNIVYVGSLSPSKGLWNLLTAASILKQEGIKLHYFILGRKENIKKTMVLIKKLNIINDISIEGYQDPFPYFIKYDLLVYPTLYDSFGNVITEALHCGCPVLASNSAGPSYILKYDELLFNVGKPNEIAEKIKKYVTNKKSYCDIRRLCSERAKEFYFDWAEQFEKVMDSFLAKQKKPIP